MLLYITLVYCIWMLNYCMYTHFISHFCSDRHPVASNLLLQWTSLCLSPYEPGLKFLWDASLEWITGSYSFLVSMPRLFSTVALPVYTAISHVQEHSSSYISLVAGLLLIFTNLVKIKTWASLYMLANSVWFSMNCLVLSIFYIGILIYSYGCVNSLYILDVNVLLFWLFW